MRFSVSLSLSKFTGAPNILYATRVPFKDIISSVRTALWGAQHYGSYCFVTHIIEIKGRKLFGFRFILVVPLKGRLMCVRGRNVVCYGNRIN